MERAISETFQTSILGCAHHSGVGFSSAVEKEHNHDFASLFPRSPGFDRVRGRHPPDQRRTGTRSGSSTIGRACCCAGFAARMLTLSFKRLRIKWKERVNKALYPTKLNSKTRQTVLPGFFCGLNPLNSAIEDL